MNMKWKSGIRLCGSIRLVERGERGLERVSSIYCTTPDDFTILLLQD